MLEHAIDRVTGRINKSIQDRAAGRLPELAVGLLESALNHWNANNWHIYDTKEANCTAQLYRWLREAQRAHIEYAVLSVELEHFVLTPAMLDGTESMTAAKRPDICISVGTRDLHVEAKRLRSDGSWCHDYVHHGMARFVASGYAAGTAMGLMVGYVQQPAMDDILVKVNQHVTTHPVMGSAHQLQSTSASVNGAWHASTHPRPADVAIELSHVWVLL